MAVLLTVTIGAGAAATVTVTVVARDGLAVLPAAPIETPTSSRTNPAAEVIRVFRAR